MPNSLDCGGPSGYDLMGANGRGEEGSKGVLLIGRKTLQERWEVGHTVEHKNFVAAGIWGVTRPNLTLKSIA